MDETNSPRDRERLVMGKKRRLVVRMALEVKIQYEKYLQIMCSVEDAPADQRMLEILESAFIDIKFLNNKIEHGETIL